VARFRSSGALLHGLVPTQGRYIALFSDNQYYQFDDIERGETLVAINEKLVSDPQLQISAFIDVSDETTSSSNSSSSSSNTNSNEQRKKTLDIAVSPTRSYQLALVY